MKSSLKLFKLLLIACCATFEVFSQSSQSGVGAVGHNAGGPAVTHYLGWDAGTNIALQIRHENNRSISLFTNNTQRLLINYGGTGNNAGQLALGNNLPGGFNPASRIHSHQDGGQNRIQFTSNTTGITGTDGFQVGINIRDSCNRFIMV